MIVTLPRTDSSMMKLRPVISEMNLARTGRSTFWKFIVTVFWGGSPSESAAKAEDGKLFEKTNSSAAVSATSKKRLIEHPPQFRVKATCAYFTIAAVRNPQLL